MSVGPLSFWAQISDKKESEEKTSVAVPVHKLYIIGIAEL